MEMKKAGKVHYLEPQQMTKRGEAVMGFTTRHEGVSRPPYNSLNLGSNTFDSPHNVEGNRSLLARSVGASLDRLVTVKQVHGTDLLVIDAPNPDFAHFHALECDGIITNQPRVLIGVTVADCVPVLLHDPVNGAIAALHAGWKGTAGEICKKGVAALQELFGSNPAEILAAVGPAIGPCCYEVDAPVMEAFKKGASGWDLHAVPRGEGKWGLDLAGANRRQLTEAGLSDGNISVSTMCVSCNPELFFSYRRDQGETGRQMGFIMLQ
ncbi:peptidoglycan editing factor PgeF [Geotalea sp. SG265]|uniref:peptidoglycan editing factor PgeF n=1 Tax=Geotalea sp. SG265 TaxID=2922867 RepID=UPI001FAF641D|nr:peptidoglycan editing factor PgeF [Geotalea sp. SG265]